MYNSKNGVSESLARRPPLQQFIGDPFGQPVPPRLQTLFAVAKNVGPVLTNGNKKRVLKYIRDVTPAAICPHCVGDGCYRCGMSGWYSLAQFDNLPENCIRLIKRFR